MSRRTSPWLYFVLTFGWSWLFWIPAALSGQDVMQFPMVLLLALGGLGPAFAAILLTYLADDAAGRRDYWRRVIDFKGIGPGWYAVLIRLSPVASALAIATGLLARAGPPPFDTALGLLSQPVTIAPLLLFTLLYGPLRDELGWRGYALDRLQGKWSALVSSLTLGIVWAAWHLPMFYMRGSYQQGEVGIGSTRFWLGFWHRS